ncbi:MAG: hypothetical protein ACTSXY_15095 [Promethearchaeota archaeon]
MIKTVSKSGNEQIKKTEDVVKKMKAEDLKVQKELSLNDFLDHLKGIEPSTTVKLPSMGKLGYGDVIVMKPILTKHQKTISMTPQFSRLPVFINIMNDRVKDVKGFPIDILNLSKNDFDFILFLFQVSLDPIVQFTVQCGECGAENTIKVDIDKDLEKSGLEIENSDYSFHVVNGILQNSRKCLNGEVEINFEALRVHHLLDIYERLIRDNKKLSMSEMRLLEMAYTLKKCTHISSGSTLKFDSIEEKIKFLEEIPSNEATILEETFEAFEHGINPNFKFKCSKCEFEEKITLPLSTDFDFFNLDEIEQLESILESQFILSKVSGIDLTASDAVSPQTREILLKIVNSFYEQVNAIRNKKK